MQTPPIHETSSAYTRWPHLINNPARITWIAGENPTSPKTYVQPSLAPYLHLPEALVKHQESLLTENDYKLELIQKHTRLRESEGQGQSDSPGIPVELVRMGVAVIMPSLITLYGLQRFTSFGSDLTSPLSAAVAVIGFLVWWWAESRHKTKEETAWDRRARDHKQARDQLMAEGTLIPLDDLAVGVRHDAGMGEDLDLAEAYAVKSGQTHETSELTTHVLDFWTRYWARSTAVRRELAEVDEILDTAPDRYESDAISQVRDRRETLIHDLEKVREETRTVVDSGLADSGSTADAARARQADQKAEAYLLRNPANTRRLLASIDRLEHGHGIRQELREPTHRQDK